MSFNDNYTEKLQSDTISPRWYCRLDFAADFSDPVYFTSHADMSSIFTTEDVLDSTLISAPVQSQDLKPISSIGTMSLSFNDVSGAVHDKLRAKLSASKGVNLKRIQVYEGFEGDVLGNYEVTGTSVIGKVAYKNGVYKISGRDVQVLAKDAYLFEPVETVLLDDIINDKVDTGITFTAADKSINSTTIDLSGFKIGAKIRIAGSASGINNDFKTVATITTAKITVSESIVDDSSGNEITVSQATIEILDESNFQMVKHGASYSDAPNVEVGYIKIGDNKIRYESTATGIFQNCTQGVLGSKQAESIVNSTVSDQSKTKVKSHAYYELPFIEFLYGILLKVIYSESGKNLPDNDTLNIDAEYIRASDFTSIGADLWDTTDSSIASICYFDGVGKINAKTFIEKEILPVIGCWMPVHPNGEWGLERGILPTKNASPSFILDDTNVVSYGWLDYNASETRNEIEINWHYSDIDQDFKRTSTYIVPDSITTNTASEPYVVNLKGVYNNRHTETVVASIADRILSRIAYPPLYISAEVTPDIAVTMSVGKVGLFKASPVKDFTGSTDSINAAMKVTYISRDLKNGKYNVKLAGSSGKMAALVGTSQSAVLSASNYTSFATTNVNITTLPSYYTVGLVGHIGNETFAGGATVGAKAYYHVGDLVFDSGTTQTITENTLLMVDGYFTSNGNIDGAGGGITGSTGTTYVSPGIHYGVGSGGAGVGSLIGSGGWGATYYRITGSTLKIDYAGTKGINVASALFPSGISSINIEYKNGTINGLKDLDLRGIGGISGGPNTAIHQTTTTSDGGGGGDGGAAFIVASKGSSLGGSADIDTSGSAGSNGVDYYPVVGVGPVRSGAGTGGHAGAVLFLNDGVGASPAVLSGKTTQNIGGTQTAGERAPLRRGRKISIAFSSTTKPFYLDNETIALRDVSSEFSSAQYIRESGTPNEEPNEEVPDQISTLLLTDDFDTNEDGSINLYMVANWTQSTDPLVDRYDLQYRKYNSSEPWRSYSGLLNRSDTTAYIPNLLAGENYQVRVRTVNVRGRYGVPVYETRTLGGKSDAPANPTSVTLTAVEGGVDVAWTNPSNTDLRWIEVFVDTTSPTDPADLYNKIAAGLQGTTQKYFIQSQPGTVQYVKIKSINSSGINGSLVTPTPANVTSLIYKDVSGNDVDNTQSEIDGGITTTTGSIENAGRGGIDLAQTTVLPQLWINSATWQSAGFQVQYNSGTPRLYAGNGADKYMQFDGTDLSVGKESKILGVNAYSNGSFYFHSVFGSGDAFIFSSVGGGTSINPTQGGVQVATSSGSTDTGTATLSILSPLMRAVSFTNWDKNLKFKCSTNAGADTAGSTRSYYIRAGTSTHGFGFLLKENGNIWGMSINSGTSTTIDLGVTWASLGKNILEAVFTPSGEVKFYTDGTYASGKDITTNLPATVAGVASIDLLYLHATNNGGAQTGDKSLTVSEFMLLEDE